MSALMRKIMLSLLCLLALILDSCGSKDQSASKVAPSDTPAPEAKADDLAVNWPQGRIVNERDFDRGIPKGDLAIKFEVVGDSLDEFEIRCRAAAIEAIGSEEKKACKEKFDIKTYEKNRLYRFELFAVHKKNKQERMLVASSFRTDPVRIILPQDVILMNQYSGIVYLTFSITSPHNVYFTCSTVSDLAYDPTMDCRDGFYTLDLSRFNGVQRIRVIAWDLETNRRLAEQPFFFCSGHLCAREIGPGAPPPYAEPLN